MAAGAELGHQQHGLQLGRDRGRRGARGAGVLPHARLAGAAGLAHPGRAPTPAALARLGLAFGGVALVLVPAGASWGGLLANLSLADALALLGGFTFAVTNVLLRRLHTVPARRACWPCFSRLHGPGLAGRAGQAGGGRGAGLPAFDPRWAAMAAALALLLMLGNWALQYGAARLPTAITGVVMLSEVLFASVSSVLLGAAQLQPRTPGPARTDRAGRPVGNAAAALKTGHARMEKDRGSAAFCCWRRPFPGRCACQVILADQAAFFWRWRAAARPAKPQAQQCQRAGLRHLAGGRIHGAKAIQIDVTCMTAIRAVRGQQCQREVMPHGTQPPGRSAPPPSRGVPVCQTSSRSRRTSPTQWSQQNCRRGSPG